MKSIAEERGVTPAVYPAERQFAYTSTSLSSYKKKQKKSNANGKEFLFFFLSLRNVSLKGVSALEDKPLTLSGDHLCAPRSSARGKSKVNSESKMGSRTKSALEKMSGCMFFFFLVEVVGFFSLQILQRPIQLRVK